MRQIAELAAQDPSTIRTGLAVGGRRRGREADVDCFPICCWRAGDDDIDSKPCSSWKKAAKKRCRLRHPRDGLPPAAVGSAGLLAVSLCHRCRVGLFLAKRTI